LVFEFGESSGKQDASPSDSDTIPTPVVVINQDSDPSATIVEITFGDRLGALLDSRYCMKPVTSSFSLLSMRIFLILYDLLEYVG
jgi:hypothetical protein